MSNPADRALLLSTWTDDFEEMFVIGSKIYLNAFEGEQGEACKSLFSWMSKFKEEGRNYVDQIEFRIQALRQVQTINKVLEKVDDMILLERFLYKLGHRHVTYLPVWLDPMYWDVFKDAVRSGLDDRMNSLTNLSREDRQRAIVIWRDIVEYIFVYVKEGFYDALKGKDRFTLTI